MSFLYGNLRDKISEKFMSVSVSHAPQKDPDFIDNEIVELVSTTEDANPKSLRSKRHTMEVDQAPKVPILKSQSDFLEDRSRIPEQVIKKELLPTVENLVKPAQVIKKELLPTVENLDKSEFLKGDELTLNISFNRNVNIPHVLHLCMYKLNRVLYQPFLEYYVIKEATEYAFPHKELSPNFFEPFIEKEPEEEKIEPINEEILGGGEQEDINEAFKDKIRIFFEEQTGSPFVAENYKGFLEINDNIFIFIEIKQDILRDKENLLPIIIDEITIKRTINLSPLIIDLFNNNKILKKIGNEVPLPRVLYLCKKEGGVYKNIYYEQQEVPHYTIINEQVLHPTFKNIYLFSEIPLPSEIPIEFIKRYAVFTDNMIRLTEEFGEPDGNQYWYTRSLLSFVEI
jgi:hypothetical protein